MKATELANGVCSILMSIHLDKSKATIRLETGLGNVAKVREEGHQIIRCRVGGEIADIAGRLPLRSLLNHHVVAAGPMCRKVMVTKRRSRRHAHVGHSLLLRD